MSETAALRSRGFPWPTGRCGLTPAGAHHWRFPSPVVTPFKTDLSVDADRLSGIAGGSSRRTAGSPCSAPTAKRNSLSVEERLLCSTRSVRGGHRSARDDARHRLLRDHRFRQTHRARSQARLRGRADAAAVLLQGRQRRGAVPEFRGDHRARRRRATAGLSLSYPAGRPGSDHAGADRAPAQSLSRRGRGPQGQLRRLEQHRGSAQCVSRSVRRVRGIGGIPAREYAQRGKGLHQRHRKHQLRRRIHGLDAPPAGRGCGTSGRPRSTICVSPCRNSR